jgi:hypothetical protein
MILLSRKLGSENYPQHYLENNFVAKAIITYLETMSEDPSQGE